MKKAMLFLLLAVRLFAVDVQLFNASAASTFRVVFTGLDDASNPASVIAPGQTFKMTTTQASYAVVTFRVDALNATRDDFVYAGESEVDTDGNSVWTLALDSGGALVVTSRYLNPPNVSGTVTVPVIGEIDMSAYQASPELWVFMAGFACAAGVRIVRAGLKWLKRAGTEKLE